MRRRALYAPGDLVWVKDYSRWYMGTVMDVFDNGEIMVQDVTGDRHLLGWWGQRRRLRPRTKWEEVA